MHILLPLDRKQTEDSISLYLNNEKTINSFCLVLVVVFLLSYTRSENLTKPKKYFTNIQILEMYWELITNLGFLG